jgi:D-alanyl-D-alanine carboxypeptidase
MRYLFLSLLMVLQSSSFAVEKSDSLQQILNKVVDNKKVFGATFAIKYQDSIWHGESGNIKSDQPFFIASTTKLFVTSIILKLRSEGKLSLNDKISKYLDSTVMQGLHIYKGKDYSYDITIQHLLAHTSGLPDYFEDKNKEGVSLELQLFEGKDRSWTFQDALAISKTLPTHFIPGTAKKAHYSDTNFQLLGKIIEAIYGKSFNEVVEEIIFNPLAMKSTYIYKDSKDTTPLPLYYKSEKLMIPLAMSSFVADGGAVSTTTDMLIFIEAFFTGKLFPVSYIEELKQWNKIFFPLQSGVGIHRFKLPWFFDPAGMTPELIGHSGLSGAMAYYSEKDKLFIVGTVNQVAYPSTSFNTAVKLIMKVRGKK